MEPARNDEGDAVNQTAPRGYTGIVADAKKPVSAQVGQYLSLALLLPVSTFVGYAIGYLLDRLFHTKFLIIVFLILGTAAGFVQLYRQLTRDSTDGGA